MPSVRGVRRAAGLVGCLALTLAGTSRLARAQPAPAPAPAPAGAAGAQSAEDQRAGLYRGGVDAASAGRWSDARDRFAAALALRASPKVLFSLAQAEEQLGRVATARGDYEHALEGAKAAKEGDVVVAAEQALAAITPRVPHVRVVATGASGAAATLDDRPIAVGVAVAVDPGAHRIVVVAPGAATAVATVAIGERQELDVPVQLELEAHGAPPPPLASLAPEAPATSVAAGSPWRAIGLIAAGSGLVAMGVGTYFALDAKSKNDASNASGCSGNACTPEAAATRRSALSAADASTVAFAIGGVLTAAGVTVWLISPGRDVRVKVAPTALASGGALAFQGEWR
jgi:hypothetical protein